MRFPKPALTVVPAVIPPPNAGDVAMGLVVEWRYDAPEKMAVAEVDRVLLRARDDGWWGVNHYSPAAGLGVQIKCGAARDGADPKRAAVLALASHLVEQRAKTEPCTCRGKRAFCLRCVHDARVMGWTHDTLGRPIIDPLTMRPLETPARDRLVDALAKSPAPPAEEVAMIVEARRPFAVGDRVRVLPSFARHNAGCIEAVGKVGKVSNAWTVDSSVVLFVVLECSSHTWGIPAEDIEHVPSAFKWEQDDSMAWIPNEARRGYMLAACYLNGKGPDFTTGWRTFSSAAADLNAMQYAPTLDEAKAAAEAAYAALVKK